jgi:6-phosphogluconolactonase
MNDYWVYVGTFTRSAAGPHRAEGIYVYRLNPASGAMTLVEAQDAGPDPAFLTLDPSRRFLYAVNEVVEFEGQPGGAVSAFSIDPRTGRLAALNRQLTLSAGPCYLCLDQTARWLLVSNYHGGSVTVLPVRADGALDEASQFIQHHGSGPNRERQEAAHAHSIQLDPFGQLALVADLGLDRIVLYRFDARLGSLTPHSPQFIPFRPGAGPRHFDFHPNGRYLYVANELDSTVTALIYDAPWGTFRAFQTLSSLPTGFVGENTGADIHIAPSGKFLYVSNRGHDSLAIFGVNENDGTLQALGHVAAHGAVPRNFAISPAGDMILVANQRSDNIVAFRVDVSTGQPVPIGPVASVPAPVCVRIVKL